MKRFSSLRLCLFAAALLLPLAPPSSHAQLTDLNQVQREGVGHMRNGDWKAAHQVFANVCERLDRNALTLFGPKFGYFWYHKGYCELKLKLNEEAAKSFEVCYTRYANNEGTPADKRNFYHVKALLKWGDALRSDEDYSGALEKYEKFLNERDPERDKFNPGELYLGMAICNFQKSKPDFSEGVDRLRTALENKERFKVQDYDIMVAFNFFCEGLMDSDKKIAEKEKIFADFIKEYRDDVKLPGYFAVTYSPMLLKLAYRAATDGLNEMSARMIELLPTSIYALSQLEQQIAMMSSRKVVRDGRLVKSRENFSEQASTLRTQLKNDAVNDAKVLMLAGNHAATLRNFRAAFGAFLQLEQMYPEHKNREDNLYQLVNLTSVLREVMLTEKYGQRFLKAFPDSSYAPQVRGMMLGSLFAEGEYELCVEVASTMEPQLPEGTEQHDTCLHVLGGSLYYLTRFEEAQPYLVEHFKTYVKDAEKKSGNAVPSSYFHAANPSRLQDFETSRTLLKAFLKEYPKPTENPYKAFALYDLANCEYSLGEYEAALVNLEEVEKDFPGATNMQQVLVLKGSAHDGLKEREKALESYREGLELAKKREDDFVASEALFNLVRMLGEERKDVEPEELTKAVPYYDEFFENYPDSPFRPQCAVAGVPAMAAADRLDEALDRLQKVIVELGKSRRGGLLILEQALASYTEAYLLNHTPGELREHFFNFPGVSIEDNELRALLSIAVIGVYEEMLEKARAEKDDSKIVAAEAAVKVQFERLRKDFQPAQMTNYVAIRLGDYLRTKTSNPKEGLPYYDRILNNKKDTGFVQEARFGKADILGRSSNRAENDQALEILRSLAASEQLDPGKKREARFRIIKVLENKQDWAMLQTATTKYLDDRSNKLNRAEVYFLHAKSFQEQGKVDSALKAYLQLLAAKRGVVQWSGPAVLNLVELLEQRGSINEQGITDVQVAYNNAATWVKGLRPNLGKMNSRDAEIFRRVENKVNEMENREGIKTLEQQRKEREERR